jgi:hypothetical protein
MVNNGHARYLGIPIMVNNMKKLLLALLICLLPLASQAQQCSDDRLVRLSPTIVGGGIVEASGAVNFSDAFSTDPFTTRFGHLTTTALYTWETNEIRSNGIAACYGKTQLNGVNQYVRFTTRSDDYNGAVFRSTGTGADGYFVVEFYGTAVYLLWFNASGQSGGDVSTSITAINSGDIIGITMAGTGAATVARIWVWTSGTPATTPTSATSWNGGAANYSLTEGGNIGVYPVGRYVGAANESDNLMDDFYGGDIP